MGPHRWPSQQDMQLPLSYLWVPARIPSKQLVVALHGQGASAEDFRWLPDDLDIPQLNYLLINAPDPYYTGFRWFDLDENPAADVLRSRELLTQVFAATEQAGYPPDQTFLLGFSQGCLMTLEFGARHVRRLAGYIGISGFVLDPVALLRDLNPDVNCGDWLVTHGTHDDVLLIEETRPQIQALREGGFKIDYREYSKAHNLDEQRELPEIREWMIERMRDR
jgi:phospholipase/carboxylesterase